MGFFSHAFACASRAWIQVANPGPACKAGLLTTTLCSHPKYLPFLNFPINKSIAFKTSVFSHSHIEIISGYGISALAASQYVIYKFLKFISKFFLTYRLFGNVFLNLWTCRLSNYFLLLIFKRMSSMWYQSFEIFASLFNTWSIFLNCSVCVWKKCIDC